MSLFVLGTLNLTGQPDAKTYAKHLEKFFQETLDMVGTVPGIGIAVVTNNQTLYQGGFGYADVEKSLPFQANTDFYIASCTKSFTGLLAAILDREDIIKLHAPLTKYLVDISFDPDLKMDQIKVRDLLTHTSGLEHESIGFRLAYTGDHTHELLMDQLKVLRANEAGRGVFEYTNLGYNIYTLIVQEKTGKSWQELLEEKIFTPLGMNRTTAFMSKAEAGNWPIAVPYFALSKEAPEAIYLRKRDNTMQSAGGLIITPADVAKWMKMQLNMGKVDGKQLFPSDLIQLSRSPLVATERERGGFKTNGYGLGWMTGTFQDKNMAWHTGGFPGSFSLISVAPESGIGVAVFVNEALAGHRLMYLLANYAYDAYWQPEGWEKNYEEQRAALLEQIEGFTVRVKEGLDERAKRTWKLSQPFPFYAGTFQNELLGEITIKADDQQISVRMGNLHCIATPFIEEETIRVELIPGSGEVIRFKMQGDKVTGLIWGDSIFTKKV